MLNSDPIETGLMETGPIETGTGDAPRQPMSSGAGGALALAGIATFVVVAIWFAFYLLVFVPRAGAP
jgi:hypothetical protein